MRARWILNVVLAAMVVGLALFAYFRPHSDNSAEAISALKADSISRISIDRAGQTPIELERTPVGWHMRTPISARANPYNVDSLLHVVSTPSEFHTPAKTDELAKYGLDKPSLTLRFDDEQIVVGAIHPLKQQHYVLHRDIVHLIPSHILTPALRDYTSLIATQLLENERQLIALQLPRLQLVQKEGIWRSEPPNPALDQKISGDRVNELVAHWQNAHALSVEKRSAKPPLDRIKLISETGGKRETLTLDILSYKPEFVLARSDEGLEYHFPEDVGRQMLNLVVE